jgi:hypothetical protein
VSHENRGRAVIFGELRGHRVEHGGALRRRAAPSGAPVYRGMIFRVLRPDREVLPALDRHRLVRLSGAAVAARSLEGSLPLRVDAPARGCLDYPWRSARMLPLETVT